MRAESPAAARTGIALAGTAAVILPASVVVMAVRHRLVVHGKVPPLSMHAPWPLAENVASTRGDRS
ncbi:hypothetical protein [Streptomyces lunaelactis]|uniref:hypothetical protein n=1 Tax=Streptomyces lunaelactis TaxID=1535768 RepID=UPI0020C79EDD|nr:hypothetical protein [Streptomyces lunaelactis]